MEQDTRNWPAVGALWRARQAGTKESCKYTNANATVSCFFFLRPFVSFSLLWVCFSCRCVVPPTPNELGTEHPPPPPPPPHPAFPTPEASFLPCPFGFRVYRAALFTKSGNARAAGSRPTGSGPAAPRDDSTQKGPVRGRGSQNRWPPPRPPLLPPPLHGLRPSFPARLHTRLRLRFPSLILLLCLCGPPEMT